MNATKGAVMRKIPVAPPVYRPQQAPKVLQTKSALPQRPKVVQQLRPAVSPAVTRPVINKPLINKPAQLKAVPRPQQKRTAPQPKLPVQMKPISARTVAQTPKLHPASARYNHIAMHSPATAQLHPLNRPANRPAYAPLPGNNQTVQPFLIEGLVLGGLALAALAYGGYRYYHRRRRENAVANVRQELAARLGPVPVLHAEGNHGIGHTSTATTVNPGAALGARNYQISINLDDPVGSGGTSDSLVESARIHERTHIAADRAYTENATPGVSQSIFHAGDYMYHTYPIADRANKLLQAIQSDCCALSREQRAHLQDRVRTNSIKPNEWDSTINELLVYTREEGIRASCNTVQLLVVYANENMDHRAQVLPRLPRLRPRLGNFHHQHQEEWAHI